MKRARILGMAAVALFAAAACSSTTRVVPLTTGQPISWQAGQAESADGTPPAFTATQVCGSDTRTYLTEALHTSPTNLKVQREWGDIVPGGKQVMISGTVATTHLGPTDLPMGHPYGDDLSMDIQVDQQFVPFIRELGPADNKPGQMHVEISSGLIPHLPRRPSPSTGQTWRQLSDHNLTGFQPGFDKPAIGDRILAMGRYIIDCGHPNYQTELHPLSFLAWAHTSGATTVIHTYANPYHDTQLYSPDASILGQVNDTSRLTRPDTKTFPAYLVDELIRLVQGKADLLRSQELIDAVRPSPAGFQVCGPAVTGAKNAAFRYDVVTRPGVTMTITPDTHSVCATLTATASDAYTALDAQVRPCILSWDYLDAVATGALSEPVDVKALIRKYLPVASAPKLDHDPNTSCADSLAGPTVNSDRTAQSIRPDGSQPIPWYGVITITVST